MTFNPPGPTPGHQEPGHGQLYPQSYPHGQQYPHGQHGQQYPQGPQYPQDQPYSQGQPYSQSQPLPQGQPSSQPGPPAMPAIPRPDPATIRIVRDSFWRLGDVDQLADRFDTHLMALTPRADEALATHFPADGERCVTAILRAVEALGAEMESQSGTDPEGQLRALGIELYRAGLEEEDQSNLGHALVRAVRDSYSEDWSTELGSSWTAIQGWIVPHLIAGAAAARSAGEETGLIRRVAVEERERSSGPSRSYEALVDRLSPSGWWRRKGTPRE
ncbi:MAG: hypothetical protein QG608_997 [Actinomycetota bacterium]|nr:hypothetical protein [Actinomycetota bacterium]